MNFVSQRVDGMSFEELDAAAATEVLGWKAPPRFNRWATSVHGDFLPVWRPSRDKQQAMQVWQRALEITRSTKASLPHDACRTAEIYVNGTILGCAHCGTQAEAITRCAVEAVETWLQSHG